jgi:AhpD family alkylhydroperoxidase
VEEVAMRTEDVTTVQGRWQEFADGIAFLPRNVTSLSRIMMGAMVLAVSELLGRRWGFFADMWFITRNMPMMIRVMTAGLVSNPFRERLMLAVTAVYGCRYCSWIHTGEALKSGVDQEEIAGLLAGSVDNCPEDEAIALLYAQHWADSDAKPDPKATRRLEEAYGPEKARVITLILHMNRLGNLSGNSLDRFLHRISFGRLGKTEQVHTLP